MTTDRWSDEMMNSMRQVMDPLADEAVKQGIVSSISPRSIERFLKSGRAQAAPKSLLAQHEGA